MISQGRIHNLLRLHHLAARRRKGSLCRYLWLLPRLQVLPRAGKVHCADA
jgi:hypothetical protein